MISIRRFPYRGFTPGLPNTKHKHCWFFRDIKRVPTESLELGDVPTFSAVGWGTALQTGRSQVRFPMVSLAFFVDIILTSALWPLGRLSPWQKWLPGIFPREWSPPVRRADNLTTFMCRLSWNLGAFTIWNPQGLSRPVMGLLYLYFTNWATQAFSNAPYYSLESPVVTICTTGLTFNNSTSCPHSLCVLCGSENKQRLFPYTALTDWFL